MTVLHKVFDTRRRDRSQKRLAVLTAASDLFLTVGYHRTRMDEIAQSLGLTKPALYNYFHSKQEILFDCHMLGHDLIEASLDKIEKSGNCGLDRLKEFIRVYANLIMTQRFAMCLLLLDEHELSPKQRAEVTKRRRLVSERFESYLQTGIRDGSIQDCNIKLTAFSIAGALNWIAHWYKPGKAFSSDQIEAFFVDALTAGLENSNVRGARIASRR